MTTYKVTNILLFLLDETRALEVYFEIFLEYFRITPTGCLIFYHSEVRVYFAQPMSYHLILFVTCVNTGFKICRYNSILAGQSCNIAILTRWLVFQKSSQLQLIFYGRLCKNFFVLRYEKLSDISHFPFALNYRVEKIKVHLTLTVWNY